MIKIVSILAITPLLLASSITFGMDQKKPLIIATLSIDPRKNSAHYKTEKENDHTSSIGIKSFPNDIMIPVAIHVQQPNGSIIDWTKDVPSSIKQYEQCKLAERKNISFEQRLQLGLKIENLRFPSSIPAHLAYNCANGSKINFTIHNFPVAATFGKNFTQDYTAALTKFYQNPAETTDKAALIEALSKGLITATPLPPCRPLFCTCPKFSYDLGPNSPATIQQAMIQPKIKPYGTIHNYVRNRGTGHVPRKFIQQKRSEPTNITCDEDILEETLQEFFQD